MITGDLIRHRQENNSFGVVMSVDFRDAKVLWLDHDYPSVERYPIEELEVTSSADLDWKDGVLTLRA